MIRKHYLINNQIRAREIRLIDERGKQIGIVDLRKALQMAQERNLDLVQVTETVDPPVCKIMDYGKHLYSLQKKEKESKTKRTGQIKGIRLGFSISTHDLETRVRQAERFLSRGIRVKIEMPLRGREKRLFEFAKGKIEEFIQKLDQQVPIKIERELKKEPRGFTMIIRKK